mmetsp:Transcript_142387/g.442754  ORF Transcript_142387/g.442754 Transcript_142387/m.442754 type:complete len:204 (+) Transcript_142387:472-1083(+)
MQASRQAIQASTIAVRRTPPKHGESGLRLPRSERHGGLRERAPAEQSGVGVACGSRGIGCRRDAEALLLCRPLSVEGLGRGVALRLRRALLGAPAAVAAALAAGGLAGLLAGGGRDGLDALRGPLRLAGRRVPQQGLDHHDEHAGEHQVDREGQDGHGDARALHAEAQGDDDDARAHLAPWAHAQAQGEAGPEVGLFLVADHG